MSIKTGQAILKCFIAEVSSLVFGLRWAQKTKPCFVTLFSKYYGQPITCYLCGSTEHVEKNSPKQRSRISHIGVEDRVLTDPPNPTTSQASENSQMETTADETLDDTPPAENPVDDSPLTQSFASIKASTPDLSLPSASRDLSTLNTRENAPLVLRKI